VDGRLLTQALRQAAIKRGLEIQPLSVDRLCITQGAVTGVTAVGQTYNAGQVAIAGGAWSRTFGSQLNIDIPVEPQRGQIIHLDLPDTDTSTWPIVSAFHSHYMVCWPDQRVVVGATREAGVGFHPQTTAAGIQEVLSEALRVAPGLAPARIREIRVGLRPVTRDTLPVLGAVPEVRNVWLAAGHGPTGLTLGPYSGKIVADLMVGQTPRTDLTPFDVRRFQ
jgi:D-amino-acid dehydrogenase